MADKTGIQWTDASWNPIRGCTRVSEGCRHCYAETVAARFSGPGQPYEGLARRNSNGEARWTGNILFVEKHLADPLRWKKPRRIFVNSMSDLFHEKVTDEQLFKIFAVMMLAEQHQFQILTKRPQRQRDFLSSYAVGDSIWFMARDLVEEFPQYSDVLLRHSEYPVWPLRNVWCGVSVEDQRAAIERIPLLLETEAAIRFLSCEPLLGSVDLVPYVYDELEGTSMPDFDSLRPSHRGLSWVIVGGESGPGARPCDIRWIRDIKDVCELAGIPVFIKQLGAVPMMDERIWRTYGRAPLLSAANRDRVPPTHVPIKLHDGHGGEPTEWLPDLRVRQFPQEFAAV